MLGLFLLLIVALLGVAAAVVAKILLDRGDISLPATWA
jgi:hypothetical protein